MNFFAGGTKPLKENARNKTSWNNLGNSDWDENDNDFIASDGSVQHSSSGSNNSDSSSALENQSKTDHRAKKRLRRRVRRGNGTLESSDDDDDERTLEISDDDKPSKKPKIETTKPRKSSRLKQKRPKRRLLIGPAESDEETTQTNPTLTMASAPKYTKNGTLDMEPVVLLTSLKMGNRMSCNLAEFLKEEADEKPSDSSDSESGEEDLKERDTTLRHIASSDESDVDLAVAKRKRRAKIESDEETQENVEETNPWLKKSKLSIPGDSDSDTDSSFDLPPLRPAVKPKKETIKKESTDKNVKQEPKTETENSDYPTSSDDDDGASGSSRSESSDSDSDMDGPPKPSILSQLAPGLLSQLRNDNTLLLDTFHRVFKLFIRDNLNSKSIDNCYNVDMESEDHEATRNAITILNRNLDEGVGNVQTGSWQHLLKERLNIHPCLITQNLESKKHKCFLCGRRRHCSDEILLFGKKYNNNSLKTDKNAKYELTAEEEAEGYKQYEAEDGNIGVQVPIGPSCLQRLLIYHELKHYKLQCYNDLGEAMERIVQQKKFQDKMEKAVKDKKGRPLGKDLDELTNIVFEKLKEGNCQKMPR